HVLWDNSVSIDIAACKINCPYSNITLNVFVVYIAPNTPLLDVQLFFELFELVLSSTSGNILLLGDFNSPFYNSANSSDSRSQFIRSFQQFCDFNQYNTITNINMRLLDLVFSNVAVEVT